MANGVCLTLQNLFHRLRRHIGYLYKAIRLNMEFGCFPFSFLTERIHKNAKVHMYVALPSGRTAAPGIRKANSGYLSGQTGDTVVHWQNIISDPDDAVQAMGSS